MTSTATGPRTFSAEQLIAQIGRGNVLATSGGRILVDRNGIILPVRYGYRVEVHLAADDTYTVERVHVAGAKRTVKGTCAGVHAEEVGEAVYRAGCYRDPMPQVAR